MIRHLTGQATGQATDDETLDDDKYLQTTCRQTAFSRGQNQKVISFSYYSNPDGDNSGSFKYRKSCGGYNLLYMLYNHLLNNQYKHDVHKVY